MRLVFTGRAGAGLCDWESFALLRDNVQHYVEGGAQSGRFFALHSIASAVDGHQCAIDAVRLRVEVLQAWSALWSIRVDAAAVTSRTRSVREGKPARSADSISELAVVDMDLLPFAHNGAMPVPKAAEAFVATVLSLTKTAVAGDKLEVRRMPVASGTPSDE